MRFDVDWDAESDPSVLDLRLTFAFACAFPVLRYVLDTFLFEAAGRKYVYRHGSDMVGGPADAAALEKTHIKFKESCWKAMYYCCAEIFALGVTLGEPWMKETKMFWIGPGDQVWPEQTLKLKLKIFYAFVGGFYTYSIFALVFWETRRKDFGVSMTHHLVTLALVLASYFSYFGRVCSLVVAIHDASDVFLELAKLSRYVNWEFSSTANFLVFAGSWAYLRLWYFPRYIIYSTSYEVLQFLDKKKNAVNGPSLYYGFNTLLILLFVLHVYWWILIARVISKQLTSGGVQKDVRSDDEDEDDD